VTEPKQAEVPLTIPVMLCIRPNGRRVPDAMTVPEDYLDRATIIEAKLAELDSVGITITAEQIGGNQVNVCLDDGEFDYKYELFPGDEKLLNGITELVLNFDVYDYRKARAVHDKMEAGE
jgi:hypothetical protein